MNSIKTLYRRIEKLETVFLFKPEKLFYETLSNEDIAKLLHCFAKDELKEIQLIQDEYEMNEFIERCYNNYKDLMNDVFATDQELKDYIDDSDFYVKYSFSLNKSDQLKLKDYNSKVSKRFEKLLINRRKKRGLSNAGFQLAN